MITVGGFNTSVDKTLDLDLLRPGEVHRVRRAQAWPGGKGLHVALTVAALGEGVRLVGLIDPAHRSEFEDVLGARGVEFDGVETAGPLRTCLALRDQGGARVTEVLEAGPQIEDGVAEELQARFLASARESALAVLSGSTPPGLGEAAYRDLVGWLREDGIPCAVDASGALLRQALEAGPFLIKPNREEAEELSGQTLDSPVTAGRVARGLVTEGVEIAIVSLGAQGAVAADGTVIVHASVSVGAAGSPVGSGDCLLGGAVVALARGQTLEDMLRLAVACGAANTLSPETGWVRIADVEALHPRVSFTRIG